MRYNNYRDIAAKKAAAKEQKIQDRRNRFNNFRRQRNEQAERVREEAKAKDAQKTEQEKIQELVTSTAELIQEWEPTNPVTSREIMKNILANLLETMAYILHEQQQEQEKKKA